MFVSQISDILTSISRINEPIPDMFGLFLNAFFIRIPNVVTKFQNFDIFYKICYILVLSSAHARRIVSVKGGGGIGRTCWSLCIDILRGYFWHFSMPSLREILYMNWTDKFNGCICEQRLVYIFQPVLYRYFNIIQLISVHLIADCWFWFWFWFWFLK